MEKTTVLDILILAKSKTNLARKIERLLDTPSMQEAIKKRPKEVFAAVQEQNYLRLLAIKKELGDYEDMTIVQLRAIARTKLKFWYQMDKYTLVDALNNYESGLLNRGIE